MKRILLFFLFTVVCFAQKETTGVFNSQIPSQFELSYILNKPDNYKDNMPLIVFLHGSGEKGTDLQKIKSHGPLKYLETHKLDCFVLAPQCPENIWWDTTAIYQLILEISSKYNVDKSRIYLTGLSMGGWGTFKLALEHPEIFAAIAPVCPPVDTVMIVQAEKLKNIPTQIYHGALDDVVPVNNSIDIFSELKKVNPNASLTIFPNDNHNSWDSTYSNPKFYEWLFQQKINN